MLTDGNCLHVQLCTVIEKLYARLITLTPYIAWEMGVSVQAAEDALQDAIVLVLQRADAAWLAKFLASSPREQRGYFLTAMRNNALKARLRNRLDFFPERPCEDETSLDPAEEVERTEAARKAWQSLPKRQREVIAFDAEGWKESETAAKLNIQGNNVRQQRRKAYRNMKKFLKE